MGDIDFSEAFAILSGTEPVRKSQKQTKPRIPTGGKFGRLPKGFVSTAKRLPRFGRSVIILDRYGVSYRAIRTQSCFYACGWVWEDTNYRDHYAEDIIAWKDDRK